MKTTALQIKFILKVYVLRGVVSPDNALYFIFSIFLLSFHVICSIPLHSFSMTIIIKMF